MGGGGKGRTTKKKDAEKRMTTKLEGGGVRALVLGPLTFFAASHMCQSQFFGQKYSVLNTYYIL